MISIAGVGATLRECMAKTAAKTVVLASACECASLAFDGEPSSQAMWTPAYPQARKGPASVCSLAYSVFGIVLLHNGE